MCGAGYFADQFGLCTIPLPDPAHCVDWECSDEVRLSVLAHHPFDQHRQSLPLEMGIILGCTLNIVLLMLLFLVATTRQKKT